MFIFAQSSTFRLDVFVDAIADSLLLGLALLSSSLLLGGLIWRGVSEHGEGVVSVDIVSASWHGSEQYNRLKVDLLMKPRASMSIHVNQEVSTGG